MQVVERGESPVNVQWRPLSVREVDELFTGVAAPWWIAGGVALDLFIGHETRAHADIDVAILRRDQDQFRERLASWDVQIAHDGALIPWPRGQRIDAKEHHEAWARRDPSGPWEIELLFEESEGDRWVYRREPQLGLHVRDLGLRHESGVQYVRPEVQLLYKAKGARAVDETDLLYVLPHLDPAQRAWLVAALWTTEPKHRWLDRLK